MLPRKQAEIIIRFFYIYIFILLKYLFQLTLNEYAGTQCQCLDFCLKTFDSEFSNTFFSCGLFSCPFLWIVREPFPLRVQVKSSLFS